MRTTTSVQHFTIRTAIAAGLAALPWVAQATSGAGILQPGTPVVALSARSAAVDPARLLGMKPGEVTTIDFPVAGRQAVVFEHTTAGQAGLRYWHGHLQGDERARVVVQELDNGRVVGAVRYRGQVIGFKQEADRRLVAAQERARVSRQAWQMGVRLDAGTTEVQENVAALTQATVGSELSLPLPDGRTEVAIVTRTGLDADGHLQIQGISRLDGRGSPTVITVGTDAVFAAVFTPRGEYQLVTRQGRTLMLDPQAAGLRQPDGEDHVVAEGAVAGATPRPAAAGTATTAASTWAPLTAGTVDTTITLLVTYSPSFVKQWGTEAAARTRLSNIVQVANTAYGNSGTGVGFKIVGWKQVSQADTTPQNVLPAMRGNSGAFAGINTLRNSVGAAMVTFFAPFNATTSSARTCGLAYVPAAGAQGLDAYRTQAPSLMYSALNDGQTTTSYCSLLSFPHELGHNLGAMHDKANSSSPGVFAYSYGKGVSGSFGTVMSYISPKVALFSSPQLQCTSAGSVCGSDTENVVATVLQTKSVVAALGKPANASQAVTGATMVAGALRTATGAAYTGATTISTTTAGVSCTTGTTGLYTCRVPTGTSSITVAVKATGKTVSPSTATFAVTNPVDLPVTGTTFIIR